MDRTDDLVGIYEIAEFMGCSKQRIHQLTHTDWFPCPVKRLKMGPLYDLLQVRVALRARGRDV